jgi:energy-coupling factor transport system permease protein
VNPLAKFAAALILSITALTTLDIRMLSALALVPLVAAPFFGISPLLLVRKAWPVFLAALSIIASLALFSADRSGATLLHFGPFWVTTSVLETSVGYALRLLALALPGVVFYTMTDPTDFADSLVQHLRASPRFAFGALAAFRLAGGLTAEWHLISLARRARGIDAGANPVRWVRLFAGTAFGLLVGAIRRGTRLALAMDARGFDSRVSRSTARISRFRWADWALLLGTAVLVAALVALAPR